MTETLSIKAIINDRIVVEEVLQFDSDKTEETKAHLLERADQLSDGTSKVDVKLVGSSGKIVILRNVTSLVFSWHDSSETSARRGLPLLPTEPPPKNPD